MITLHASTLPYYADCPRRSAIRIIPRLLEAQGYVFQRQQPNIGAAIGHGTHAAAAHLAAVKLLGEQPAENHLKNGIELGISGFREEIKDGVSFDGTTTTTNEAEKQIITLSTSVLYEIMPALNIVTSEPPPLRAAMQGIEFTGRWDIEEPDGIDDYKTGTSARACHAQLGGYSLLRTSNGREKSKRLTQIYLPRVSVKKQYPGAQRINYDVDICETTAYNTIKHIVRDIRNFETTQSPQVFMANPCSVLCSQKFCAAFGTEWCEFGKGI
jgi:hypothetical protein